MSQLRDDYERFVNPPGGWHTKDDDGLAYRLARQVGPLLAFAERVAALDTDLEARRQATPLDLVAEAKSALGDTA